MNDKQLNICRKLMDDAITDVNKHFFNVFRNNGEPASTHSIRLGMKLYSVLINNRRESCSLHDWDIVIASILHDLIEDTDVTDEYIKKHYGQEIYSLVKEVTFKSDDWEDLNIGLLRLSKSAKLIKLFDRLDNAHSLKKLDEPKHLKFNIKFAYKTYMYYLDTFVLNLTELDKEFQDEYLIKEIQYHQRELHEVIENVMFNTHLNYEIYDDYLDLSLNGITENNFIKNSPFKDEFDCKKNFKNPHEQLAYLMMLLDISHQILNREFLRFNYELNNDKDDFDWYEYSFNKFKKILSEDELNEYYENFKIDTKHYKQMIEFLLSRKIQNKYSY